MHPLVRDLVQLYGEESARFRMVHALDISEKAIGDSLEDYQPSGIARQVLRYYLQSRYFKDKCRYFSFQLKKYESLCLTLGIDPEFKAYTFDDWQKDNLSGDLEVQNA